MASPGLNKKWQTLIAELDRTPKYPDAITAQQFAAETGRTVSQAYDALYKAVKEGKLIKRDDWRKCEGGRTQMCVVFDLV